MPNMIDANSTEGLVVNVAQWDEQALETVCGIANAGGGFLLFPLSQRERRRSKRIFEAVPDEILEAIGIQCVAVPVMDGLDFCLELEIPPADEPVNLNDTYWLYVDGVNTKQNYESIYRMWQDDAMSPWELKSLPYVEESDFSSEALLTITAIPLARIENSEALKETSGSSLKETVRGRLEHLGLTHPRTKYLVNAGAVLLCTNPARFIPGATVHLASFGYDGNPTGVEDEVVGPLATQINETVRLLMEKYLPSISTTKAFIKKQPPEEALREAVTNALLHKDYSSGVSVRITVAPDQIVIQNVGSIPPDWTENDLTEKHSASFRNPLLCTTARLLGIAPAWGEGIEHMMDSCQEKGAELPHYEISSNRTSVVFPLPVTRRGSGITNSVNRSRTSPSSGSSRQGAAGAPSQMGQGQTFVERSIAAANRLDLTQTDEYVLQVITKNGRATAVKIAQVLGVSERTVRRSFKKLREHGFIERVGSDKAGYWIALE